jgi:hypothetical protein
MKSPFGTLTHNRGTGTLYDGTAKIATVEAPDKTPAGYAVEVTRAVRLRDCANACHGLDLPPSIAPGALAALVDWLRWSLDEMDKHALPMDTKPHRQAARAALAPFTPDPAPVSPPVSAFESDPLGNGRTPAPQ